MQVTVSSAVTGTGIDVTASSTEDTAASEVAGNVVVRHEAGEHNPVAKLAHHSVQMLYKGVALGAVGKIAAAYHHQFHVLPVGQLQESLQQFLNAFLGYQAPAEHGNEVFRLES